MKRIFTAGFLVVFVCGCTNRQMVTWKPRDVLAPPFDMKVFARTCSLAEALACDDRLAWYSTDSIMAQKPVLLDSLDRTWFVDERDGRRYVFYGRFSEKDDAYYPKYTFVMEADGSMQKINAAADGRAHLFGRAVTTGMEFFTGLVDSVQPGVEYNHYIRKNSDGTFSMWFFPSGYGNYCAHGVDITISIDAMGKTVIDHSIVGNYLRYFEIDRKPPTVELDNTYDTMPSLGNVFFVMTNRERFKRIKIVTTRSISSMVYLADKKEWVWVHGWREDSTRAEKHGTEETSVTPASSADLIQQNEKKAPWPVRTFRSILERLKLRK